MSSLTKADIEATLSEYIDPYLQQDLRTAKAIQRIEITEQGINIALVFGYPLGGIQTQRIADLKQLFRPDEVDITVQWKVDSHVGQHGMKGLTNVKNIIAVASGKGGVGKSTTAVNLALALAEEGARVGILDADIYGPSQPMMLGITQSPEVLENKKILPLLAHGLQSMSIGYLIDKNTPMIWRGPMVSMALQQLLHDTQWDNLDYLVIDLPPGTGDIQLTLAQKIPVSGALIVTTPQDLALLDARRAYEMFQKVNVPILGIVENMSIHTCSQCGHQERIFGEGGGEQFAAEYKTDLLGVLPLDSQIRAQADSGKPTVVADPQSENAHRYREIARRLAAKLSLQGKDYSSKFPSIVIQND